MLMDVLMERGVFGGGYSGGSVNTVDYITIHSQGNAITFGTLSVTRNCPASVSSSTRGYGVEALSRSTI